MFEFQRNKVIALYRDESNKYLALRFESGYVISLEQVRNSGIIHTPDISRPIQLIFSAKTKEPIELTRIDVKSE